MRLRNVLSIVFRDLTLRHFDSCQVLLVLCKHGHCCESLSHLGAHKSLHLACTMSDVSHATERGDVQEIEGRRPRSKVMVLHHVKLAHATAKDLVHTILSRLDANLVDQLNLMSSLGSTASVTC